jgi:alpha-tubulin suppressor-like RCC1 family protein
MIITGEPGTGKTSTIICLAKEIYKNTSFNENVLELNASDDRGLSIINNTISTKIITNIACGSFYIMLLDSTGIVYGCGLNTNGQLGQNNTTQLLVPTLIQYFVTNNIKITNIACGAIHTIFLDSTSRVYSCGSNDNGQLGQNNTTQLLVPTLITSTNISTKTITNIICGYTHTIFLENENDIDKILIIN